MSQVEKTDAFSFDVLLIVAMDSEEPLGVDVSSDISNFLAQGFRIGLLTLSQSSSPKRYRNSRLIRQIFELGVPVLGRKDVARSQLAIIYNHDLFLVRGVRGAFAAQEIWVVMDSEKSDSYTRNNIVAECSKYSPINPTFMCTRAEQHTDLSGEPQTSRRLWNFHAGHPAETLDRMPLSSPARPYIGLPTPPHFTRPVIAEIKDIAADIAEAGYVLCARTAVPGALQTGKADPDLVVGFPFVSARRADFLKSLQIYVVPKTMLKSGTWREDVYACMYLGVPVALPRELQPYFEDSALYYDEGILRVLQDQEPSDITARLKRSKYLSQARSYAASATVLRGAGLSPSQNHQTPAVVEHLASGSNEDFTTTSSGAVQTPIRVCFVTSNGAGMGHLTRLLAVARRLGDGIESSFISMSQACGVVAQYGYEFEYIPSKGDLQVEGGEWNRFFTDRFMQALNRMEPDVVVFDGTWPYQGVAHAVDHYGAKFVWMRRGMWRAETPATSLVRNTGFDLVIEPGDVASAYDHGPTGRAIDAAHVEPIIVLDPSEVYDRESARRALGISHDDNAMLLTLGAGNINKIDDDVNEVIRSVKSLPDEWRIFMTSPLIAEGSAVTEGVETLAIYPLALYAKAFDFVVSATGYNSFHEWLAYGIPALWIANGNTITDDQIGRARYAHDFGLGFAAGPGGSVRIPEAVRLLGERHRRDAVRQAMHLVSFENGADEAASLISELARDNGKS